MKAPLLRVGEGKTEPADVRKQITDRIMWTEERQVRKFDVCMTVHH